MCDCSKANIFVMQSNSCYYCQQIKNRALTNDLQFLKLSMLEKNFKFLKGMVASLVAQLVIHPQCGRPGFDRWIGKIPWRREWQPTPVFWPGEFHGLYSPWGHKVSDMTEQLSQ